MLLCSLCQRSLVDSFHQPFYLESTLLSIDMAFCSMSAGKKTKFHPNQGLQTKEIKQQD